MRRLAWGAVSIASCTPVVVAGTDAGTDAGYDAGAPDAGTPDAGTRDAGYDAGTPDAGCPCLGASGRCAIPPDFPPDAADFMVMEVCDCRFIPVFVCWDETDLRCPSWTCFPARVRDGGSGVELREDGGYDCLC